MTAINLEPYVTTLKAQTASCRQSQAANRILELVANRVGSVSRDTWKTPVSLSEVLLDFCYVDKQVSTQDKQRRTVSRAWIMYLLHQAMSDWLKPELEAIPEVRDVNALFVKVIIPSLSMTPVVTRLSFTQAIKHALYLIDLEASSERALVPFTLEAFNTAGFADLHWTERTKVLRLVKGTVKKSNIVAAMTAYKRGERNDPVHQDVVEIVDIVDTNGEKVTEVRTSDMFVNASIMLKKVGTTMKLYRRAAGSSKFLREFTCKTNQTLIDSPQNILKGTFWVHSRVAIHLANWCGLTTDLDSLLSHIPIDTIQSRKSGQNAPTPEETEDSAMYLTREENGNKVGDQRATGDFVDATQLPTRYALEGIEQLVAEDGTVVTEIRKIDGYVNATRLCNCGGKKYTNFSVNHRTKEYLVYLANHIGIKESELMECNVGRYGGTWVHPLIATRLAIWISEAFAVKVSVWLEAYMRRVPSVRDEYNAELTIIEPCRSDQVEADVRRRLAIELSGEECIIGMFGEVDLVTASEVIEIKNVKRWTHALGQALAHSKSFPDKSPRVHLFGEENQFQDGVLERAVSLCDDHSVRVTHEFVTYAN
jgi:hypothetical protein